MTLLHQCGGAAEFLLVSRLTVAAGFFCFVFQSTFNRRPLTSIQETLPLVALSSTEVLLY